MNGVTRGASMADRMDMPVAIALGARRAAAPKTNEPIIIRNQKDWKKGPVDFSKEMVVLVPAGFEVVSKEFVSQPEGRVLVIHLKKIGPRADAQPFIVIPIFKGPVQFYDDN
jgi:hypothetical protein